MSHIVYQRDIYFSTFSTSRWAKIFSDFPELNMMLLSTFLFCTKNFDVEIYAFVIMPDHFHIVWSTSSSLTIKEIATRLKSYSGSVITKYIEALNEEYLYNFHSTRIDRKFKIWNLDESHFKIDHTQILIQKINYIHNNPTKGSYKVVVDPSNYLFSSARAYYDQKSNFPFLTVMPDVILK